MRRAVLQCAARGAWAVAPQAGAAATARQQRWCIDQKIERRQKLKSSREELVREARSSVKEVEEQLRAAVVANDAIPVRFLDFLVTHEGSIDGDDEKLPKPKELTRKEVFGYAKGEGYDVCLVGEKEGKAVVRLRYLKPYIRQQVLQATSKQRKQISQKIADIGERVPSSEFHINVRPTTEKPEIRKSVSLAVQAIRQGKAARVFFKLFSDQQHAEQIMDDYISILNSHAAEHNLTLAYSEKHSSDRGGGFLASLSGRK